MRTIVSKFGGSSTANAAQFRRIFALLRASPARRCAVLSAPGTDADHREKVTTLLERCWEHRGDALLFDVAAGRVVGRFREIAGTLGVTGFEDMAREELRRAREISKAALLSRGEYLCARLFSLWSGIPMLDAAELIAFDSSGAPDMDETLSRLRGLPGRFILPGFYGAGPDGRIVTFPRNGSDISGALAAAGLGAGLYENWSDVPGLMTADPAIVPSARRINQISYRQMRAVSRAGARILHPAALDPVALAGIPTRLRQLEKPECFGTLIDDHCAGVAKCIAGRREEGRISVFGIAPDKAKRAIKGMPVEYAGNIQSETRLTVSEEDYEDSVRALHGMLIGG